MNWILLIILVVLLILYFYLHKRIKNLERYYKDLKIDNEIFKASVTQQIRKNKNNV